MLKERFINPEFFYGLVVTGFFAYLTSKLMRYIVKKYEVFPAPKGISQYSWETAFNSPNGVLVNNRIIGFMEAILYFVAFYIEKPELIGGWLAFKVASKWHTWSMILKIPKRIENVDQFEYISAKNVVASHTLYRWLMGNIANILAGLLGCIISAIVTKYISFSFLSKVVLVAPIVFDLSSSLKDYFSTMLQAMVTLVVMAGIFLVFRLEYINHRINSSMNAYRDWSDKHLKGTADPDQVTWLEKDIFCHILAAYERKRTEDAFVPAILDYFSEIHGLRRYRDQIKISSIFPAILISLAFLISSLCYLMLTLGWEANNLFILLSEAVFITSSVGFMIAVLFMIKIFREVPEARFNNPFANSQDLKELRDKVIVLKRRKIEKILNEEKMSTRQNLENILKNYE